MRPAPCKPAWHHYDICYTAKVLRARQERRHPCPCHHRAPTPNHGPGRTGCAHNREIIDGAKHIHHGQRGTRKHVRPPFSGYRHFMRQLVAHTEQFPGQVLPSLTRLQTFGSPLMHWVRVTVDPASDYPFQVQPVMVRQP